MRVFVSHASKNREIVLRFTHFLEMVSSDIEVFCSSEAESITVGSNCIEQILDELNACTVFVPILSEEYYESKFCMIELGIACSYFFNRYKVLGENYIFPFALYPIKQNLALSGTPVSALQVGDLENVNDVHSFLGALSQKGVQLNEMNRKLHSFCDDINKFWESIRDRNTSVQILGCFDDSIDYLHKEDVIAYNRDGDKLHVRFNMNPSHRVGARRPNFISVVLKYADPQDFSRYLKIDKESIFRFSVENATNAVKRIFVEFKHFSNLQILKRFSFPIKQKQSHFQIPLEGMKSHALEDITEICFVIHPDDVRKEEGEFVLEVHGVDSGLDF